MLFLHATFPPADPPPLRSIGLFIYTQVLHKSSGTTSFGTIKGYSGSTLAWTMLKYINSAMGKVSGGIADINIDVDIDSYPDTDTDTGVERSFPAGPWPGAWRSMVSKPD
jgi:hypothetical protein